MRFREESLWTRFLWHPELYFHYFSLYLKVCACWILLKLLQHCICRINDSTSDFITWLFLVHSVCPFLLVSSSCLVAARKPHTQWHSKEEGNSKPQCGRRKTFFILDKALHKAVKHCDLGQALAIRKRDGCDTSFALWVHEVQIQSYHPVSAPSIVVVF